MCLFLYIFPFLTPGSNCSYHILIFCSDTIFFIFRQGLIMVPILYSSAQHSSCLCSPNAGITAMTYHPRLKLSNLNVSLSCSSNSLCIRSTQMLKFTFKFVSYHANITPLSNISYTDLSDLSCCLN